MFYPTENAGASKNDHCYKALPLCLSSCKTTLTSQVLQYVFHLQNCIRGAVGSCSIIQARACSESDYYLH